MSSTLDMKICVAECVEHRFSEPIIRLSGKNQVKNKISEGSAAVTYAYYSQAGWFRASNQQLDSPVKRTINHCPSRRE